MAFIAYQGVADKGDRYDRSFLVKSDDKKYKRTELNDFSQKGLAHTSSTPGKTQLVNHFLINDAWYLVDLPGYGYARMGKKGRDRLQEIIGDYILHSEELVLLFVLLDARHDLQQIDQDFITELAEEGIPFALIYTKCDKLGPVALKTQVERNAAVLSETWEELPPTFCTSAETGQGRDEVLNYIETILHQL